MVVEIEIIVVTFLRANKTQRDSAKKGPFRSLRTHIIIYAFNETGVDVNDGKYIILIIYYNVTQNIVMCVPICIKHLKKCLTADNGLLA